MNNTIVVCPEEQRLKLTHVYSRNLSDQTCQDHAKARAICRTMLSDPRDNFGSLGLALREFVSQHRPEEGSFSN